MVALQVDLISNFSNKELPSELPLVMCRTCDHSDEGEPEPLENQEAKTVGAKATQLLFCFFTLGRKSGCPEWARFGLLVL